MSNPTHVTNHCATIKTRKVNRPRYKFSVAIKLIRVPEAYFCLPDSHGMTVIWVVMWVAPKTQHIKSTSFHSSVNKTLSCSYFSLVTCLLADEIFAEVVNMCAYTHSSSYIAMDDSSHVRDAINMWPHLISFVTKLIQLESEDCISRKVFCCSRTLSVYLWMCVCHSA